MHHCYLLSRASEVGSPTNHLGSRQRRRDTGQGSLGRGKKCWVSTNPTDPILAQSWIFFFFIFDELDAIPKSFCNVEVSYYTLKMRSYSPSASVELFSRSLNWWMSEHWSSIDDQLDILGHQCLKIEIIFDELDAIQRSFCKIEVSYCTLKTKSYNLHLLHQLSLLLLEAWIDACPGFFLFQACVFLCNYT